MEKKYTFSSYSPGAILLQEQQIEYYNFKDPLLSPPLMPSLNTCFSHWPKFYQLEIQLRSKHFY